MNKYPIILVSNEDFVYGFKKGYYKDIPELNNKNLLVYTKEDIKSKYHISLDSSDNEDVFCVLNPYTNTCTPLDNSSFAKKLIIDEAIAVREALVALGAKHIFIQEEVTNKTSTQIVAKGKGKTPLYKGELSGKKAKDIRINLKKELESSDPSRKPESLEICYNRIYERGLSDNSNLISLYERLKDSKYNRLFGEERLTMTIDEDLNNSLDIVAGLSKLKVFSANGEFTYNSSVLHSFRYEIIADFGPHTSEDTSNNVIDE